MLELIDGDLFMVPSPTVLHQAISRNILTIMYQYLLKNPIGKVFSAPIDVVLSPENMTIPDLVLILARNYVIIGEKNINGSPDLIIEILSTNRLQDLEKKGNL